MPRAIKVMVDATEAARQIRRALAEDAMQRAEDALRRAADLFAEIGNESDRTRAEMALTVLCPGDW